MNQNNLLLQMMEKNQVGVLLKTNQYTQQFGLSLTEQEAQLLAKERRNSLSEQQRVEFGEGIMNRLIFAFCDSPYLYQDNYVDTMIRLQEIFYLYKNETMDYLTDDELISYMKKAFHGRAEGSLDYLEDTALNELARKIRKKDCGFFTGRTILENQDELDLEGDEEDEE